MKAVYLIDIEPTGDDYRRLVSLAPKFGDRGLLVVQYGNPATEQQQLVMNELQDHIVSVRDCSDWPGTQLFGGKAAVYEFALAPSVVEWLASRTERLYGWMYPDLPEDLSFLNYERKPWLTTVSHECDAWIEAEQNQIDSIRLALPSLKLSLQL